MHRERNLEVYILHTYFPGMPGPNQAAVGAHRDAFRRRVRAPRTAVAPRNTRNNASTDKHTRGRTGSLAREKAPAPPARAPVPPSQGVDELDEPPGKLIRFDSGFPKRGEREAAEKKDNAVSFREQPLMT